MYDEIVTDLAKSYPHVARQGCLRTGRVTYITRNYTNDIVICKYYCNIVPKVLCVTGCL